MAGKLVESESVVTSCDACGGDFPPKDLKRSSVPSIFALAAIGNSEPDDPDHIIGPHLVDRKSYCSTCCVRVNLRRAVGIVALILIPLILAGMFASWLW